MLLLQQDCKNQNKHGAEISRDKMKDRFTDFV